MFAKKIRVIAVAAFFSLSICVPAFAAMSLEEYDQEMYAATRQLIEDEIYDETIRNTELEILEAFKSEIYGNSDLTNQQKGSKVIAKIAKDKNVRDTQWKSAFQKSCENYSVPNGTSDERSDSFDAEMDSLALSKLHILQWDQDQSGVNKSALKIMLTEFMRTPAIQNVMGICMSLAAALCIAFGIGSIIEKAAEKNISTDALWREFIKMIVGLVIIFNSLYFAAVIIYIGNLILSAALNNTNTQTVVAANANRTHMALWQSFVTMEKAGGISLATRTAGGGDGNAFSVALNAAKSFMSGMMGSITNVPGQIFNTITGGSGMIFDIITKLAGAGIMNFIISLTVYAIGIDIGLRFIFTPLAVADLYSEKFRSTGVRWLKALAAASLQGVIVYVVVIVGTALRTTLEGGAAFAGFAPVTGTIVNLTMIGFFAKSKAIANEII